MENPGGVKGMRDGLKSLERRIRRLRDRILDWPRLGWAKRLYYRHRKFRIFSIRSPVAYPTPGLSWSQAVRVIASLRQKPKISIVVPLDRAEPAWLEGCIRSVTSQYYPNWELILVDDGSRVPTLAGLLQARADRDDRILHRTLPENRGIVGSSNYGISLATGSFVGFLDHDDRLSPDALTWVAAMHNQHEGALWFFSDEDQINSRGNRHSPFLKPDFSPEYLLSCMFTGRFSVYSSGILKQAGGFREGFDGCQDHDLALRLSEMVPRDRIVHIPRILYHSRHRDSSTAASRGARPHAAASGKAAVAEAIMRRGLDAAVESHPKCHTRYRILLQPRKHPRVTIIIPTRDAFVDLKACLDSLRSHTRYPDYRILVIDNQSEDPELLAYLADESCTNHLQVLRYPYPFNHSAMNNLAVGRCESELIVLMNNDVQLISDRWLEMLVATAEIDPSTAGVGALLLFRGSLVQHGGILLGARGVAGHMHRCCHAEDPGYFGRAHALQEVSAATAALLLMRRSAFLDVGGFDAQAFPTSYNDVDLWLRLRAAGYRCLYNPEVRGMHYESKTRSTRGDSERLFQRRLLERWGADLQADPFYNPNLALDNEQFQGFRDFPVELPELATRQSPARRHSRGFASDGTRAA